MNKKCVSEKGKPQGRRNEQWTSYEHYKQWTKRRQNKWGQIEWRENELHKMNDEFLMTKTK